MLGRRPILEGVRGYVLLVFDYAADVFVEYLLPRTSAVLYALCYSKNMC